MSIQHLLSFFDQTMRTLLLRLRLRGSRSHFEESIGIDRDMVQGERLGRWQKFAKFQLKQVVARSGCRRIRYIAESDSHLQGKRRKGRKRWFKIELCLSEPNTRKHPTTPDTHRTHNGTMKQHFRPRLHKRLHTTRPWVQSQWAGLHQPPRPRRPSPSPSPGQRSFSPPRAHQRPAWITQYRR
jgi:hypothetical protein